MLHFHIDIPLNEDLYTPGDMDNSKLTPMMREWMSDHIDGAWNWGDEWSRNPFEEYLRFRFESQDDLMRFALKWGRYGR